MDRVYKITSHKRDYLCEQYIRYGCSPEEAERYAGMAFNCAVVTDDGLPDSNAWEIDFSTVSEVHNCKEKTEKDKRFEAENSKKNTVVYSSWLKSGWNRTGFWENVDYGAEGGNVSSGSGNELLHINLWGNSYTYWKYLNRNGRKIDSDLVDAREFAFRGNEITPSWVPMLKLPLQMTMLSGSEHDQLQIRVNGDAKPETSKRRDHVFLLDVSGSMGCRMILAQLNMVALFHSLSAEDHVTLITYSDTCRMIDSEISAADTDRFCNALSKICFIGGYGKKISALKTAYSYLNAKDFKGTVTVFCDGYPDAGEKNGQLQKEFARIQNRFGIRLNCMVYGSDSWADRKLVDLVSYAGGRLLSVLEPDNIGRAVNERWLGTGDDIYDVKIRMTGNGLEAVGMPYCFSMTPGASFNATFLNNKEHDSHEEIEISWSDRNGEKHSENITVPVTALET